MTALPWSSEGNPGAGPMSGLGPQSMADTYSAEPNGSVVGGYGGTEDMGLHPLPLAAKPKVRPASMPRQGAPQAMVIDPATGENISTDEYRAKYNHPVSAKARSVTPQNMAGIHTHAQQWGGGQANQGQPSGWDYGGATTPQGWSGTGGGAGGAE